MEPGVPFALLGAVQLLAIGAALGLAAAGVLRRNVPGVLVALGAVVLAGAEVTTALRLGDTSSDGLAVLRATAALVLGGGLLTGGLGPRRVPGALYGVVVPLAAAGGPASFAGAASLLAAAAAVRGRRDTVGLAVGSGLVLWGAASFVSISADAGSGAPVTVLVLRGLGALALLAGVGVLAQASLLSKVVGAILVGVLAMAVAAVGVVGNVVVSSYATQDRNAVQDYGAARVVDINNQLEAVKQTAGFLGSLCDSVNSQARCAQFVLSTDASVQFVPQNLDLFLVRVPRKGSPSLVAQTGAARLSPSALLGLRNLPAVSYVLNNKDKDPGAYGTIVRLTGAQPAVAVAGVAPHKDAANPSAPPAFVYVYGALLDQRYAEQSFNLGGYGLYFLAGEPLTVTASSRSAEDQGRVLALAKRADVASGVLMAGRTIGSEGSDPTVTFLPLQQYPGPTTVAYVAVSRDAGTALKAERDSLRLLVITALLALLVVAGAALVLGRRTVDPVRRLTLAAERIAAGDLAVTTGIRSRDEVGTLARQFDTMTAALGQLTGDLRESAARLSTVLLSMSDGLLATDGDGIVTSVNRAALEMLGLEEVDVLGESLSVVADVRDVNGTQLADAALRLRDEAAEVLRPNGSRVPVRVALTPLQGVDGVVMVLRDTTREREVERMKTEFLSNVSHELRTPLTPIRGYAEILVSKPGLPSDRVTTFATTIRDEALKMNRVVDLLVDVAALEAGRVSVAPHRVTAKELLDQRLALWEKREPARKKDLKRRVAAGLPALHVDPIWVGKALDELIDNAVKYTRAGTSITLGAALSPDGSRIRVSVKDAGAGIPEADQETLFTSFEQVDGSATRKVGGLGLGLSFVRRLAEDAGFPLNVHSKVGKGAEFSLDLPISDEPAPRRTAPRKR